jgi:ParB family chromosome partitioning protein
MANTAKKKTTKAAAATKKATATKTAAKKQAAAKAPAKKTAAKTAAKKAEPAKKAAVKKAAPKAAAKTAAKPVAKKAPMKKAALGTPAKAAPVKKTAVKTVSESKSAMGRGLGALLSSDGIPENKRDSVVELKLNDISPNDGQPRKNFDEEKINSLASSIEENGIIQPIIVQKKGDGYRIVAGERRWRAARIAGLSVIPAIVRDLTDRQTMEQALIENIQREDLNPIEEAMAIQNLLKTHKLTQDQLAKKLGKGRSSIANTLRILELDESLQEFVSRGDLSEGHAKVILGVKDKEDQRKVADYIMTRDLNVRQAEVFVKKFLDSQNAPDKKKVMETLDIRFALSLKEVETKFKKGLGAKTKIKVLDSTSGRGRIVIDYKDYEDLDRLTELLCGQ